MLTPEYMWVQEVCEEMCEMETDMAEYMGTHPALANPGSDIQVRILGVCSVVHPLNNLNIRPLETMVIVKFGQTGL